MGKLPRCLSVTVSLLVAACGSQLDIQPINYNDISSVEAEIKRQIGVYMSFEAKPAFYVDSNDTVHNFPTDPTAYYCGSGQIEYDIFSVKADLTTTTDATAGGSISVALPLVASPTLGGGYSRERVATQELVYNVWFKSLGWYKNNQASHINPNPNLKDLQSAPIATVLVNLRNALIASSLIKDPVSGPGPFSSNFLVANGHSMSKLAL